jgi:hypothetical protein
MPNFNAGCQQQEHKGRRGGYSFLATFLFSIFLLLFVLYTLTVSRDSAVGIATGYGLDD